MNKSEFEPLKDAIKYYFIGTIYKFLNTINNRLRVLLNSSFSDEKVFQLGFNQSQRFFKKSIEKGLVHSHCFYMCSAASGNFLRSKYDYNYKKILEDYPKQILESTEFLYLAVFLNRQYAETKFNEAESEKFLEDTLPKLKNYSENSDILNVTIDESKVNDYLYEPYKDTQFLKFIKDIESDRRGRAKGIYKIWLYRNMLCVLAENLIYYNLNLSEGRTYLKKANKYKYTSDFSELYWDSFTNAYLSEDPTKNIKEALLIILVIKMQYPSPLTRKNDPL